MYIQTIDRYTWPQQSFCKKEIIFPLLSTDKKCSRLLQSQTKQIQKSYRSFCNK